MLNRTQFARTAAATTLGFGVAQSCASHGSSYEKTISQIWRHTKPVPTGAMAIQRELVRYATLAASSHNTQCWKFKLENSLISILPDFERSCPAVDPDDHHLYVSLGCATENLLQAAQAHGLQGTVDVATAGRVRI